MELASLKIFFACVLTFQLLPLRDVKQLSSGGQWLSFNGAQPTCHVHVHIIEQVVPRLIGLPSPKAHLLWLLGPLRPNHF